MVRSGGGGVVSSRSRELAGTCGGEDELYLGEQGGDGGISTSPGPDPKNQYDGKSSPRISRGRVAANIPATTAMAIVPYEGFGGRATKCGGNADSDGGSTFDPPNSY